MTILHEMWLHRREDVRPRRVREAQGSVATEKFKVVYVAPMKALVKEMVESLGRVGARCEAVCRGWSRTAWRCASCRAT